jgi:hypothetical protein
MVILFHWAIYVLLYCTYKLKSRNGFRMTFTGQAELCSNITRSRAAIEYYSNGTLRLFITFDDGSEIERYSLSANSGPWGCGPGPNGEYLISARMPKTRVNHNGYMTFGPFNKRGYNREGVSFKIYTGAIGGRDAMWIHPDQDPEPGSAGCTGLTCDRIQMISFRNTMAALFLRHGKNNRTFLYSVNITNNPNYPPCDGSNTGE